MAEDDVDRDDERMTVRVFWPGDTDVPVQPVNQFLVSAGLPDRSGTPDGIYLVVGHAAPPVLYGADEVKRRLATEGIPIKVCGRYQMTRGRLAELIEILTLVAERYDKAMTQREGVGDE